MKKTKNIWKFPAIIEFETVPQYSKKFEKLQMDQTLVFDLSNTQSIHSSFVGFLIYAKKQTEKEGGNLSLIISPYLEKIFKMLNIGNFLPYSCIKKSA